MRARIVTDTLRAVKLRRLGCWLAAIAISLPAPAAFGAAPARGDVRLLVVLAAFPDHPLDHDRAYFAGTPASLVERFIDYYREVSAGRLRLQATVGSPVVVLPAARRTYVQQPQVLARDALRAFAETATEPADRDALGTADALVIFFAGPGRESHVEGGDPNDPWSNYTVLVPPATAPRFAEACVIAEEEVAPFGSLGVLCHEFGHLLGLPELYAPGRPQEGIGVWGLMGQGTWLGGGEEPPHPCGWSKLHLGWVDVQTVDRSTRGIRLPAVEEVPQVVKIPVGAGNAAEYYLLENRQRIGADRRLPGDGLLVWHVDESVGGFRSAEQDAGHKLLHLVEADGRGDLDRGHAAGGNRGDATDPFRGPPPWRRRAAAALALLGSVFTASAVFRAVRPAPLAGVLNRLAWAAAALAVAAALGRSPSCGPATPGMQPYDGSAGRVAIRNISPSGHTMSFDVRVVD